jgi:hypothetical protein
MKSSPFNFDQSSEIVKKVHRPSIFGRFMRFVVWGGVGFWCILPFLWLILTFITNLPASSSSKNTDYDLPRTAGKFDVGSVVAAGGGSFLAMAFGYGVWCSIGVVCGCGMERAITVTSELFSPNR